MTTYSTNLALTLIGSGEQDGTWGTTTNTNLGTLLEQAISGYVTYACTGGTDTITIPDGASGVARNMYIELTGTGGGTVVVPSNKKLYYFYNNTTSGDVTVKVSGQTGYTVPNGVRISLVCNGTDVVAAINYVPLVFYAVSNLDVLTLLNVPGLLNVSGGVVKLGGFTLTDTGTAITFGSTLTYTASMYTTVMTVTAATVGYVRYGQAISGTGVTVGTTVGAQLTSTETAIASPSYSSGGAVGASTFVVSSATGLDIGQMISGTGVPDGTYVIKLDGTTVWLGDRTGAAVTFTIQAAGTYAFKPPKGKGTYTVSASQTVSSTTITATQVVAQITNTGVITSNP